MCIIPTSIYNTDNDILLLLFIIYLLSQSRAPYYIETPIEYVDNLIQSL